MVASSRSWGRWRSVVYEAVYYRTATEVACVDGWLFVGRFSLPREYKYLRVKPGEGWAWYSEPVYGGARASRWRDVRQAVPLPGQGWRRFGVVYCRSFHGETVGLSVPLWHLAALFVALPIGRLAARRW